MTQLVVTSVISYTSTCSLIDLLHSISGIDTAAVDSAHAAWRWQVHQGAIKARAKNATELSDAQLAQQSAEMAHAEHRGRRFSEEALQAAERRAIGMEDAAAAAAVAAGSKRPASGALLEQGAKRQRLNAALQDGSGTGFPQERGSGFSLKSLCTSCAAGLVSRCCNITSLFAADL